jgi:formate dehydrogenase iron-sulfur subunit
LEWKQDEQAKTAAERAVEPNKGLQGGTWTAINLYKIEAGRNVKHRFVKTQCLHCVDPACAGACFAKALQKTPEGPVVYNQGLCVGCRYCMLACPFDIIKYEWEKAIPGISKCRMCSDLLDEKEEPACVSVCPTGAITFGSRKAMLAEAKRRISEKEGGVAYKQHIYGEEEAGGTSWLYISDVPFEDMRFRQDVPTVPLTSYTEPYMTATPIVGLSWAAILTGIYFARNKGKDPLD